MERIKGVERELLTARKAVDEFIAALKSGDAELPPNTKLRDAETMSENLEGTYLIRLFAAFESGLRSYWATFKDTTPPSKDLIDSIAGRRGIPDDTREDVHAVREYRNSLVHENESETTPIEIGESRSRLCTFFARLPDQW
ncbi:MAG: hypothetical protein U0792_20895 [Gemmataceae bacterium]